jgi:hypothetical protein
MCDHPDLEYHYRQFYLRPNVVLSMHASTNNAEAYSMLTGGLATRASHLILKLGHDNVAQNSISQLYATVKYHFLFAPR